MGKKVFDLKKLEEFDTKVLKIHWLKQLTKKK